MIYFSGVKSEHHSPPAVSPKMVNLSHNEDINDVMTTTAPDSDVTVGAERFVSTCSSENIQK